MAQKFRVLKTIENNGEITTMAIQHDNKDSVFGELNELLEHVANGKRLFGVRIYSLDNEGFTKDLIAEHVTSKDLTINDIWKLGGSIT